MPDLFLVLVQQFNAVATFTRKSEIKHAKQLFFDVVHRSPPYIRIAPGSAHQHGIGVIAGKCCRHWIGHTGKPYVACAGLEIVQILWFEIWTLPKSIAAAKANTAGVYRLPRIWLNNRCVSGPGALSNQQ